MLKKSDCDIDCLNFDDEASIDENHNMKWPIFNPNFQKVNLEVGKLFSSQEEFKNPVQNWSIARGNTIKFSKNNKVRCKVICRKSNCSFHLYSSKYEDSHS